MSNANQPDDFKVAGTIVRDAVMEVKVKKRRVVEY